MYNPMRASDVTLSNLYLMLVHDREPVEWHEICLSLQSFKRKMVFDCMVCLAKTPYFFCQTCHTVER